VDEGAPAREPVNPPPAQVASAAFLIREGLAVLFVCVWLALFAASLVTGAFAVPFWFDVVAVTVLGYALGLNAAEVTQARPAEPRDLVRRARGD